ncbi:MAG: hypothetical protein AAF623_05815 [Planctomycetota bacterium]
MARAKAIQFEYSGSPIEFRMLKVDRSKLYGYKDLEVLDELGNPCELTTLAEDGKTLIGKGGTGIGYLTADGNWCDKAQLKAVDLEGEPIEPVPSSFSAPILLEQESTVDDYLNHNIRLIYRMEFDDCDSNLIQKLKQGTIFQFPYSYRGGLEADAGFLLMNHADEVFFLVGDRTGVDYKTLQQSAPVAPPEEDSESNEDSLMDFGMI